MKTQEDIIKRLAEESAELFNFFPEIALAFLTFEQAKPFLDQAKLKEAGDAASAGWTADPILEDPILKELKDYMDFAWGKVENHRGLSAGRSVAKMEAWCWLLGKEKDIDWTNYTNYGAPILKQICELFEIPLPTQQGLLNMAAGEPCEEGCEYGCGE